MSWSSSAVELRYARSRFDLLIVLDSRVPHTGYFELFDIEKVINFATLVAVILINFVFRTKPLCDKLDAMGGFYQLRVFACGNTSVI